MFWADVFSSMQDFLYYEFQDAISSFTIVWKHNIHLSFTKISLGCSHGVMVKVLDCRIVVSEFKLQAGYYFHFWSNTLGKGMNPIILPAKD